MGSRIIVSSVRASFGQGTAGKEAAESALLCQVLMHGQKPFPPPAFWHSRLERAHCV